MASCSASIGGNGPEAVPQPTSTPRRFSEASEPSNVSLPTVS